MSFFRLPTKFVKFATFADSVTRPVVDLFNTYIYQENTAESALENLELQIDLLKRPYYSATDQFVALALPFLQTSKTAYSILDLSQKVLILSVCTTILNEEQPEQLLYDNSYRGKLIAALLNLIATPLPIVSIVSRNVRTLFNGCYDNTNQELLVQELRVAHGLCK